MSELLESRWQETKGALLEGLNGNKKAVMSATLENTRKHLMETATAGAIVMSKHLILPFIPYRRRVMPASYCK